MKRRASLALVSVSALVLLALIASVHVTRAESFSVGQAVKPEIRLHLRKTQTGTGPVTLEAQLIIAGGTPPITVHLELNVDTGQGGKLHPAALDKSDLRPGNETWYTWKLSEEGQYTVWAHAKATNAAGVVEIDDDNEQRLTFRIGPEPPQPSPIGNILMPVVIVAVIAVGLYVIRSRRRAKPKAPPPVVPAPPPAKPAAPPSVPAKPAAPAAPSQPPPPVVPPPPTPAAPPAAPLPTTPPPGIARFCPSCGARLPPGATFCAECGTKI